MGKKVLLGFNKELEMMLQFIYCVLRRLKLAVGEVSVDSKVYKSLWGTSSDFSKLKNTPSSVQRLTKQRLVCARR